MDPESLRQIELGGAWSTIFRAFIHAEVPRHFPNQIPDSNGTIPFLLTAEDLLGYWAEKIYNSNLKACKSGGISRIFKEKIAALEDVILKDEIKDDNHFIASERTHILRLPYDAFGKSDLTQPLLSRLYPTSKAPSHDFIIAITDDEIAQIKRSIQTEMQKLLQNAVTAANSKMR